MLHRPFAGSSVPGAVEIMYIVENARDGSRTSFMALVAVAARRAYTVTFGVEEADFAASRELGTVLLRSFKLLEVAPPPIAPETPADPERVVWVTEALDVGGVEFARPAAWTREPALTAGLVEFTCARGERRHKSLRVFAIDLTAHAASGRNLSAELVAHYKSDMAKARGRLLRDARAQRGARVHAERSDGK